MYLLNKISMIVAIGMSVREVHFREIPVFAGLSVLCVYALCEQNIS